MDPIVEICCGHVEDVAAAEKAGADRIEFNQAMHLGGLIPSIGALKLALKKTSLPIVAMARPRPGGFCYTEMAFQTMLQDVEEMSSLPIQGVAFGVLNADRTVDVERSRQIVDRLKQHGKEAVFHRAFDCVENPHAAMESLIELGVDRVLTSGLQPKAMDGADLLKELQETFGSRIEIVAGSGVNAENVRKLKEATGLHQFHSSCKGWKKDPTTVGTVSYAYADAPNEDAYDVVEFSKVNAFVDAAKQNL